MTNGMCAHTPKLSFDVQNEAALNVTQQVQTDQVKVCWKLDIKYCHDNIIT